MCDGQRQKMTTSNPSKSRRTSHARRISQWPVLVLNDRVVTFDTSYRNVANDNKIARYSVGVRLSAVTRWKILLNFRRYLLARSAGSGERRAYAKFAKTDGHRRRVFFRNRCPRTRSKRKPISIEKSITFRANSPRSELSRRSKHFFFNQTVKYLLSVTSWSSVVCLSSLWSLSSWKNIHPLSTMSTVIKRSVCQQISTYYDFKRQGTRLRFSGLECNV